MDNSQALLKVENLRVSYRAGKTYNTVVKGVSFDLGRERLGIVGESGSGKSTIGRALLKLLPTAKIEADRMDFGGTDLISASEKQMLTIRGRRISMILQDPKFSLNPVHRVGDQIAEAYRVHTKASAQVARQKTLEMLDAVKIRDPERVFGLYPHEVSGGMGQRIMIAMMLIPEPQIIIADEPTSALDVTVRMQVLNILNEPGDQQGLGTDHDQPRPQPGAQFLRPRSRHAPRRGRRGAGRPGYAQLHASLYARPACRSAAYRRQPQATSGVEPRAFDQCSQRGARMTAIDVRNLSIDLGYGLAKKRILGDVCFSVEAGESFGLVGESGSGKSTILRCIARLLNAWDGDIELEGRSVADMPFVEYCRTVQMVFQDPYGSLHPRQSIRTALQEPLRIHRMDRQVERMERALIDVGLNPAFLSRYPHELSGGQRQRVAIARALILEPRILLLDEPTSALDVSVQAEVLNLLADLRAKRNLTYLFVSHDLAVIDHMCERLAVMQHGRVVEVMSRDVLATGQAKDPYARELIQASLEYDHAV